MGIDLGSPLVEQVMMHCRVDSAGNIEYSNLEARLQQERREYNTRLANSKKPLPVAKVAYSVPWRGDVAHKQKIQSEQQTKLIAQYRPQVYEIFTQFEANQITADDVISRVGDVTIILRARTSISHVRYHEQLP
jgi:Tfp pilus assembly protein PilP